MEIITAVLSGDRCLEIRLFTHVAVSIKTEQKLTRRLCRIMDRKLHSCPRLDMYCYVIFRALFIDWS